MGHIINFTEFKENTSKGVMHLHSIKWAAANCDREENPSGSYSNVWKMHNQILDSREEAEDYLDSQGVYFDGCVRYKSPKTTKAYKNLCERLANTREKKAQYDRENDVRRRQAEFIGCLNCGSKLAKKHLGGNRCPLCGEDLRSETVRNRLKSFDERIKKIEKQMREEGKKSHRIKWLVKTEVHC